MSNKECGQIVLTVSICFCCSALVLYDSFSKKLSAKEILPQFTAINYPTERNYWVPVHIWYRTMRLVCTVPTVSQENQGEE